MTIDDKIRNKKLRCGVNSKTAKISELSSGKIDKYEYLTAKKNFPSGQSRIIEQAKFTYFPLGRKNTNTKEKNK